MEITATELKLNLGKYLDAAQDEVITITKNGKAIARLISARTFKYDLSELEAFDKKMSAAFCVSETPGVAYGSRGGAGARDQSGAGAAADVWMLTRNGEPIAELGPIPTQKRKRKLGFMPGPPASPETDAALFESDWSDEDYEKWVNEKW